MSALGKPINPILYTTLNPRAPRHPIDSIKHTCCACTTVSLSQWCSIFIQIEPNTYSDGRDSREAVEHSTHWSVVGSLTWKKRRRGHLHATHLDRQSSVQCSVSLLHKHLLFQQSVRPCVACGGRVLMCLCFEQGFENSLCHLRTRLSNLIIIYAKCVRKGIYDHTDARSAEFNSLLVA